MTDDAPTRVLEPDPTTTNPAPSAAPAEAAVARQDGQLPGNRDPGSPPHLAEGVELMGQMEDSGFEETPFLARRADGKVIQLPQILYTLADQIDGTATYEQIAKRVTEALGAEIEADDTRFLVDEKLAPLGLIAGPAAAAAAAERAEEQAAQPKPANDLLALTWKAKVISEGASRTITNVFRPLFFGPIVTAVVAAFFGLVYWFFFVHGISQAVRAILYNPALLVMVFAGVVVATAFHEVGHATACRYGGAKPGVMGVGLYVIWPVFYTDVTSAYGLDRRGRLRTDLGGVYFNAIFALAMAGVYAVTTWEPILVLVMVQTFAIVQQLLPLGRLDGYLILTDLTGVPDLLGRMKPILRSAVPGNEPETEVAGLKPWVRRVATAYLVVLIPVMVLIVVMMILHAPRVFATAYDSLGVRWDKVTHAFNSGQVGTGIGDGFQCLALVLPALGMVVSSGRIGKRLGTGTWRWSAGSPLRRAIVLTGTAAAVGLAAYTWWPNGDYRPIQPGERGTLTGGLKELSAITTGRPSLTPQRQQQLHGAPFEQPIQARTSSNSEPHQSSTNRIQVPTTTETTPTTTATTPADTSTATTPTTTDTSTTTTPTTTDTSTTTTPTTTTTDTSTTTTPTTTDTTTTTTP
jgi:putative peptide zinc metalloprotease protein